MPLDHELDSIARAVSSHLRPLRELADALRTPLSDLLKSSERDVRRKLGSLSVDAMGKVLRALDAPAPAIEAKAAPSPSGEAHTLEDLARIVLELPIEGSRLRAVEHAIIEHALATCDGNKSAAARLLGIERKAIERRARRGRSESRARPRRRVS